jgi:hypothetical protein
MNNAQKQIRRDLYERTDVVVVEATAPSGWKPCELCGTVAELRPYGPNAERVCFPCGMKDEAAMERGMAKRFGVKETR